MKLTKALGLTLIIAGILTAIPRMMAQRQTSPTGEEKLLGQWKVVWNSAEIKGSAIYEIRKVGDEVKGYSVKLMDEEGYSQDDNTLVFILKKFDGSNGGGIYKLDYEGKNYDFPCKLKLNSKELEVSYSFYDFSETEIWTKIEY